MPILDLDGAFGTDVRPPRKSTGRKLWARDPSQPGSNDGTRLDATAVNDLIGMLRTLVAAAGIGANPGDDDALVKAILALILANPPEISALTDGGGFVRMTDGERTKLAALVQNYKGSFADLSAVAVAYPEATAGDWAVIMRVGEDATIAVWDDDASPAAWVEIAHAPPQTASTVPFTPVGNLSSTNVQDALEELNQEKQPALGFTPVPETRQVTGGGLAQGGGALEEDQQITVPKAAGEALRGGTNDTHALTAKSAFDAIAEVTIPYAASVAIDFASGIDFVITLTGPVSFTAPTNTASVVGKRGRIRIKQDATGGRVATWNTAYKWPGNVAQAVSTGANKEDFVDYEVVASGRVRVALTKDVPT